MEASISERLKSQAMAMGFDGAAIVDPPEMISHAAFSRWVGMGYAGEMSYLPRRADERKDLRSLLPDVKSVLVVIMNYYHPRRRESLDVPPDRGVISRYAWGDDYHDLMKKRLLRLLHWLESELGQEISGRAYVDTGPILERELAARAGLGFIGKNTCLINHRFGSWVFLGELLLSVHLPPDVPPTPEPTLQSLGDNEHGRCGGCTSCMEACPTGAIVAPHVLDARKCISYLTIELRGPIPREMRPLIGNRIFGCDICQEVCPWNKHLAVESDEPAFAPRPGLEEPELLELIRMDEEEFRKRFRKSPIKRAKRRGFLRNVAVALGNWGAPEAVPALSDALDDDEPLIRGHAAWALGRIGGDDAVHALRRRLRVEENSWVREEISLALDECAVPPP